MGTGDEEGPPGPVTLGDALLRIPLHRLPAGFKWGAWVLGGALGGLPVLLPLLNHESVRMENMMASAGVSAVLFALYLLVVLGGHPHYSRWVGVVCVGIIGSMIVAVVAGFLLPPSYPRSRARMVSCLNNLKQIGTALRLYSAREECYPEATGSAFLERLYQTGDLPDLRGFLCRESGRVVGTTFVTDYVVNPTVAGMKAETEPPNPSAFPVIWESKPFHGGGQSRCVLFMDWDVKLMQEPDFQAMLAKGTR